MKKPEKTRILVDEDGTAAVYDLISIGHQDPSYPECNERATDVVAPDGTCPHRLRGGEAIGAVIALLMTTAPIAGRFVEALQVALAEESASQNSLFKLLQIERDHAIEDANTLRSQIAEHVSKTKRGHCRSCENWLDAHQSILIHPEVMAPTERGTRVMCSPCYGAALESAHRRGEHRSVQSTDCPTCQEDHDSFRGAEFDGPGPVPGVPR